MELQLSLWCRLPFRANCNQKFVDRSGRLDAENEKWSDSRSNGNAADKRAAQFLQIVLHMVTLDSFALAMMGRASTGLLRVPVLRVKGRIPRVGRRW